MILPMLEGVALPLIRATVLVRSGNRGAGAGIVWQPGGLVITCAHVVQSEATTVELFDGRRYEARLVGRDRRCDLAALAVEADDLSAAAPGTSTGLRVGELVVAVGHPLGVPHALGLGIVQAQGNGEWLRADVRLAPGNSGGPLADSRGRVVGVNAMVVSGLALAVPVETVERFVARIGRAPSGREAA